MTMIRSQYLLNWLISLCWLMHSANAKDLLESGFANPPAETKPWCYWYWISDNISKEGITRDLEAMARIGIGEAFIGNIFLDDVPAGKVKVLTPEWWSLVEHAIREGGRTGVNIGMFNCPGWSQSGGPWIKPTESMRYLVASETRVTGPAKFSGKIAAPNDQFQDVAILAFPEPKDDTDSVSAHSPNMTSIPAVDGVARLFDGNIHTAVQLPVGPAKNPFTIEIKTSSPFTVRSLQVVPGNEAISAECELQAANSNGEFKTVRRFKCDRSNMGLGVGFMPRGPVTVSFSAVTAKSFRVIFTDYSGGGKPALAEIILSGAARLESFVEKQLGKMHPTPLPLWDTYLWLTQPEPESLNFVVPSALVRNITKQWSPDGTVSWDVPPGEWIIQRIGMSPTGMRNAPASPEGEGLEVDKMNRALAMRHFDAFIGQLLKRMPASDRKSFTRVVADSYEMGSQNWTDGFDTQFLKRYGYDPKPWLPALTGRLVDSADQSERFLWDLRRLVADRVATDYVGGLREACNQHGLGLWLENYGHWGFPSEFLKYGSESDRIGGEYWVTGDLGSIELRAASSCANTYGRKFVSAESFTGGPAFQNAPGALKARGDWSFCEGVNHFVLHVNIHQPWEDKLPGVNAWFGTEFNRHNTWFERSKAWVDYVRRCCWLLQQGHRVADVAYFIGEDAPKMTGVRKPELPQGRDFDYINADVIETKLGVKNGVLALPHGTTYRILVLPELETMRPETLRKIRDLTRAGATVYGTPPSRSPSMENYPKCDDEVRTLAAELWGGASTKQPGERTFGKGRILWGKSLDDALASQNSMADFQSSTPLRFTHRQSGNTDIYFVANPKAESLTTTASFRAGGKAPEFWWPDSGNIESPAVYDSADGVVRLPISLGPNGSVFVVFRQKASTKSVRIVSVMKSGREILSTKVTPVLASQSGDRPDNFTFAAWIKPADATTLVREANHGVVGMGEKRNDVLSAPHGNGFGGSGHAGCGLAVGTNGVCVFEHGANYFAPTLVHAASIDEWTHLAVVYNEGQPNLYLNGKLVRTGLKSKHIVHSGASAGAQAQFRGRLGGFTQFSRTLNASEIEQISKTMPRPDQEFGGPPIHLSKTGRKIVALAAQAGEYEFAFADGRKQKLTVNDILAPIVLDGPWEVQFSSGSGTPERVTFDSLCDWTQRPEEVIRYYSGKATYRKAFDIPISQNANRKSRFVLDLGELRDMATVRLNGKEIGTLWHAPWQLDITSAIKPDTNLLEIEIVNVWNNRLVGDLAMPVGQRRTFLLASTVTKNAPLLSAGLLGPVALRSTVEITLSRPE